MSVFDLDYCRGGCGTPVGHQEDYCDEYPNCRLRKKPEQPSDLLSIADQLAEAARRHLRENTAASAIDLNTQVSAWDAAMKGRK